MNASAGFRPSEMAPLLPAPYRAVVHESLGSTSDEAKALALAGAPHGTLVWAREQTSGRGRLDRSWASPPGNLYMSVVLRPAIPAPRAAELGFVAALAVADTASAFLSGTVEVSLKWPNDVLAAGGKIAGILLEAQSAMSGEVDWVVLGIGMNLASAPADARYQAAALYRLGPSRPEVRQVLERLVGRLAARIEAWAAEGFAVIRAEWLARAHGLGQPIEVRERGAAVLGRFVDLDADGALLLGTEHGIRRITVGDVSLPGS